MAKRYGSILALMADVMPEDPDFVVELAEQIIQRQAGEINKLQGEIGVLTEDSAQRQKGVVALADGAGDADEVISGLQGVVSDYRGFNVKLGEQIKELEAQIVELEESLGGALECNDNLGSELRDLKERLSESRGFGAVLAEEIEGMKAERARLDIMAKEGKERLERKIVVLEGEVADLKIKIDEKD